MKNIEKKAFENIISLSKRLFRKNPSKFSTILVYFVLISYFLLFLESFTYHGFLKKHFYFDTLLFLILVIIYLLWFFTVFKGKITEKLTLFLRIHKYFYIFLIAVFVLFQVVEQLTFPNFIFSKLHLIPTNLIFPLVLGTSLFFLGEYGQIILKEKNGKPIFLAVILSIIIPLFIFGIFYGSILLGMVLKENFFILTNLDISQADKFRKEMGVVYDLTQLVSEKTEESARILIPPQISPYDMTGNVGFFRYFVYPRFPVNGGLNNLSLSGIDYVLIARGEAKGAALEFYNWPKEIVKAEKIFILRENGQVEEIRSDYVPEKFEGRWGLIKLLK